MRVRDVLIDGRQVEYEHRDGLLRLMAGTVSADESTITVRATGIPDPDFAYLDSAIDYRTVVGANPLHGLGTEASLFDRRYVALMPNVHWLPSSAASSRNFARVDLVVRVPEGWLVAGPGSREDLGNGRFRFAPRTAVTQVALLASTFERMATTVDGIDLELLLSPRHTASA